ncbi:hypothetical protein E3N88_19926 [Mikania micrantha]|uniref:Bifunctional inhibitor/plant lipid transfer protein/seed storage helical domain-containing protein n=1 Tax=Mikania micrantha TaxID=192012 RepID=A0A5N6NR80_9ASTR|nr:hypothetical protein E3N88_19926 [Mikania micrantha]
MMLVWGACGDESLAQQCSEKLPEVMTCTAFASGKESSPEAKCCDSVKEMKESNPACLCFLIQQIHNGTNPMLQKMNIQEARLLQLPSACKIANATISDCPNTLTVVAVGGSWLEVEDRQLEFNTVTPVELRDYELLSV